MASTREIPLASPTLPVIILTSPTPPIIMLSGYESQKETSFTIRCYDSSFRKATAISDENDDATTKNEEGKVLFHVEGTMPGTSWSWRRKVFSGSSKDDHIYDFRHNSFDVKNGWVIETSGANGKPYTLCSLIHRRQVTSQHAAINATVRTQTGEDVIITMRSKDDDHEALTCTISVDGTPFATIHKEMYNGAISTGKLDKSEWKARVAPGVDLSLVMILVLCRAEMEHVWSSSRRVNPVFGFL